MELAPSHLVSGRLSAEKAKAKENMARANSVLTLPFPLKLFIAGSNLLTNRLLLSNLNLFRPCWLNSQPLSGLPKPKVAITFWLNFRTSSVGCPETPSLRSVASPRPDAFVPPAKQTLIQPAPNLFKMASASTKTWWIGETSALHRVVAKFEEGEEPDGNCCVSILSLTSSSS